MKKCNFDPKILIFGTKSQFFVWKLRLFVKTAYHRYARGYPQKNLYPQKNSVSILEVIFRGSPRFSAVSGHSQFAIISTLNFGPSSRKLGGTMTTDLVPAGITEKRPFLRSTEKCFMPQSVFPKKKHPIFAKRPIFILEKGTYFFCHMNPNLVNGPFVTLKETVHFQ